MRTTIKLAIVVIAAFIMCSCTNNERKVEKVAEYYSQHGYKPVSCTHDYAIHDDNGNYYIVCLKNDTIYLDTEFKNRGKSARKIFPNERGTMVKTLKVDFRNGDGALVPINDFHLDLERIFDVEIKFHDGKSLIDKDLLLIGLKDGKEILYYIGSNEGLLINDRHPTLDYPKLICEEDFTLHDVYPNTSYLVDYPFSLTEEFSLKDLSFTRLLLMRFFKSNYPWSLVKENLSSTSLVHENDLLFDTKASFECLEQIHLSVAMNRNMQLQAELEAEQQREQEEMKDYIIENAISFRQMFNDYQNSIKANELYHFGMEVLLRIVVDKIDYSSNSNYTYVIKHDSNADGDAYLYSNDNGFVTLSYPQTVWVKAKYKNRYDEDGGDGGKYDFVYEFTDVQLLLYKEYEYGDRAY